MQPVADLNRRTTDDVNIRAFSVFNVKQFQNNTPLDAVLCKNKKQNFGKPVYG